jgi:hypothetical protein
MWLFQQAAGSFSAMGKTGGCWRLNGASEDQRFAQDRALLLARPG